MRLIELMHDFVLFDAGVKKLPRVHQYFGIKAAQEFVRQEKGGIIWHTQGSGSAARQSRKTWIATPGFNLGCAGSAVRITSSTNFK